MAEEEDLQPQMEVSLAEYKSEIPLAELVKLGAVDNDLFARTFFPRAAKQKAPLFHREMDELLENPSYRMVNLRCFRGSAKTTKLRIFTGKRIAYGMSKTILYVGATEPHAARSIRWLRAQIEEKMQGDGSRKRPLFAAAFGLSLERFSDTELKIVQTLPGAEAVSVWVLGVGITSSNIRGINFDDYRPDLIVLDDVVTDENASTVEQRDKISNLVLGAVSKSLAPATEEPNAKLAILQTPIHADDISARATKSEAFRTATFGCWTEGTKSFPIELQESIWPERYPTATLRQDKKHAIELNALSLFQKEMECNISSPEQCPFKAEWLQYRKGEPPLSGLAVLAIDPVPPPSDKAIRQQFKKNDFEAHTVWRRSGGNYHLVEEVTNRGHNPSWSVTTALSLAYKHRVSRIVLQSIAYERTLKWLLQQEMTRRGVYYMLVDTSAQSNQKHKYARIIGALQAPASHGKIWVDASQTGFITQFVDFKLGIDHDDILDSSAIALLDLINPHLELGQDEYYWQDDNMPKLEPMRNCP